jgi:hypothetical protein
MTKGLGNFTPLTTTLRSGPDVTAPSTNSGVEGARGVVHAGGCGMCWRTRARFWCCVRPLRLACIDVKHTRTRRQACADAQSRPGRRLPSSCAHLAAPTGWRGLAANSHPLHACTRRLQRCLASKPSQPTRSAGPAASNSHQHGATNPFTTASHPSPRNPSTGQHATTPCPSCMQPAAHRWLGQ